jgi:hypothetical protein
MQLENGMTSSQQLVSSKGAAFARLASRVLEALNEAVDYRRDQGQTLTGISEKIGCHRSALTRALNGTSANLTLRSISDILWAVDFDPKDFSADPVESISPNWICTATNVESASGDQITIFATQNIQMNVDQFSKKTVGSVYALPQFEMSIR